MWLYSDNCNCNFVHSEDNIMPQSTWQTVMDTFISNTPEHLRDEFHLKLHFITHLAMLQRDALETFELVSKKMLEVVNNDDG